MNSQVNMYESNSQLSREQQLLCIIVFLVTIIIKYKSIEAHFSNSNSVKKNKEEENWAIWSEETKDEEKDVNKWYIIPGDEVSRYKGMWKDGLANGKGIKEMLGSSTCNHSIIEAEFKNGCANGYGKQTFDITKDYEEYAPYYEGEFKDGNQHGLGTYYYGCGSYVKGNLVENKFQGQCINYNSKKNKTWIGTYVDDKKENGDWVDGELKLEEAFKNITNDATVSKLR